MRRLADTRWRLWAAAVLLAILAAAPAWGYVDLAPTLARVVLDSERIVVVEVAAFSQARAVVVLKEVRALRGGLSSELARHVVAPAEGSAIPRHVLRWAEPGSRGVLFVSGRSALVCVGEGWYQVSSSGEGVWRLGLERPDLPLAYYGSVSRLAEGVERMLAGKDAVLTAVPHGAEGEGATIALALNRPSLPGLVKVQRIRANLRMPSMVMAVSPNSAYMLGMGPVGEEDLPALLANLKSADAALRTEAADGLRSLGLRSEAVRTGLAALLEDAAPDVRLAGASALLHLRMERSAALEALKRGLESNSPAERRKAAWYAGLAGPGTARARAGDAELWKPIVEKLAGLLGDPDGAVRAASLQALATLGPLAAPAAKAVAPLLEDRELAIDAADAIGRMGPAARPLPARLATMLADAQPTVRWAAVRAMCQVGGEEARPALDFMIRALPTASEMDGYNMMVYFALLGPAARDAIPAIQRTRIKNPVLPSATIWAIECDRRLPWQTGGRMGMGRGGGPGGMGGGPGDISTFIYEAYVRELGEALRPAASLLARKILDGSAGNVPAWGYELLTCGPGDAVAILAPALADPGAVQRERAAVALGYMGPAAAEARDRVASAIGKAATESERRLLQWCLREITRDEGEISQAGE